MLTMRHRVSTLCEIATIILLASPGMSHAQGVTVSQSTASITADCATGDAVIQGSRDSISLRNSCRSLTVNGSGNSIIVDLQAGGSITLNGAGNTVSYRSAGGTQSVSVADNGRGNTVSRQGGPESATTQPGATAIIGSTASPGSLTVHGDNGDTVQIGPGGITAIPGAGTTGGMVQINPGGIAAAGAAATLAAPAGPGTSGQLVFSGNGQSRDVSCAGERVYVSGDNGRFILRGGCAGVAIQGNADTAQVELVPGSPIAISGNNSIVYFTLTPPGADPTLIVSGGNSHAIRVGRLGEVNGIELTATVRSGSLAPPASVATAAVNIATPQAALAAANGETVAQLQHNLGAVQTPQGVQVRLSGDVLFDFNKDTLRPDAQRSLAELSVLIARNHPHELRIVGYTDSIGTPQYNLDLSDRRAHNVERWMLDYGRVQAAALDVGGRGASDPVAPNTLPDGSDNPAGRQANRRVEVLLEQ